MHRSTGKPLVSVIVPVRDDSPGIRELLRLLASQRLPQDRFELVIGDDGSQPGELDGIATGDDRVRVVRGPRRTSYAARNRAAAAARGPVLAFCDSDCLPEPDWLEQGLAALDRADLVAGEVTFAAPDRATVWSLLTIDMFLDQKQNVAFARAVTANLFVRRDLFDALGGFDESLPSGGDYDFGRRAVERGRRLAYASGARVRHPTIDRARPLLRKVWRTNRWAAFRTARAGERPQLISVLTFFPIVGVALARRQVLRPASDLHRGRLAAAGVTPSRRQRLRAMAVLYTVVSCAAGLGRIRGWLEGRRYRRRNAGPTLPIAGPPTPGADEGPRAHAVTGRDRA